MDHPFTVKARAAGAPCGVEVVGDPLRLAGVFDGRIAGRVLADHDPLGQR